MANRSEYPNASMHHEAVEFEMQLAGAGAANLTIPATPPAADNFAVSGTRSGAGVYALVYKEGFPRILNVHPEVWTSDGNLKLCVVTSVVEATRTINIKVWDAATPTAADLAATDTLRLTVKARKSLA